MDAITAEAKELMHKYEALGEEGVEGAPPTSVPVSLVSLTPTQHSPPFVFELLSCTIALSSNATMHAI